MRNKTMNKLEVKKMGKPETWLVEAAAEIGLDLAPLIHETTNEFISHSMKRHGDEKTENARGQIAVTAADIDRIPEIIKAPDLTVIGIKRKHETFIVYTKACNGNTYIYYEEVLNGNKNKALRSKTMFIKKGIMKNETFLNILKSNAITDISGIKIVVGAGGHPGRET